jgi:hypothetical protein
MGNYRGHIPSQRDMAFSQTIIWASRPRPKPEARFKELTRSLSEPFQRNDIKLLAKPL